MSLQIRALHVLSGDLWAGAEVQAFTLISQLAQMPHTEVAAVLLNEGLLAERLRSAGISVWVMDERRMTSMQLFVRLRGVLAEWEPNVVHTHRDKENVLGALANRFCRNAPSVRTVHGAREHDSAPGWRGARHRLLGRIDRWCGRRLQQKVISVSRELAERLAREFSPEKIIVIENGVDIDAVKAGKGVAEFRSAEPEAVHVGIVGRLVRVKRVDLFIQAAALLQREYSQRSWRFHIFGDGPLRPELERLSADEGVASRVTFHGHRLDIPTCLAGLDALVISSDHEGMPMVALEAASLGVATVAHAVGGLPDLIPGPLLVARHDALGYRDGVLKALGPDAQAIVQDGAAERLQRFSSIGNAERIRRVYEQVIAEFRGSGQQGKRWGAINGK